MCRRFTLAKTANEVSRDFPELQVIPQLAPRYNVAPVQPVVTVLNMRPKTMDLTQWGLIPSFAEDPSRGYTMINIFADKFRDKAVFKRLLRRKRCIILADGYYEWKQTRGNSEAKAEPMYITLRSQRTFAFAGIFDEWHDGEGGFIITSSIITTRPNIAVRMVAETMPVLLEEKDQAIWLDPHFDKIDFLQGKLLPYAPEEIVVTPVTDYVNRLRNDDARCIQPTPPGMAQTELF